MNKNGFFGGVWHLYRGILLKPFEDFGKMVRRVWIDGIFKIHHELTVKEMMELLTVVFRVHIMWFFVYFPVIFVPFIGVISYAMFTVMSLFAIPVTAFALIAIAIRRYINLGIPLVISITFTLFAMSVEYQWFEGIFVYPRFVSDTMNAIYLIIALGCFIPGKVLKRKL